MRALKMPATMTIATMITAMIWPDPKYIPIPLRFDCSSSWPVPQPLDLALEAAFLVDRDPLDHLQPLLELPDLLAQPHALGIVLDDDVAIAAAAAAAEGGAQDAAHPRDQ